MKILVVGATGFIGKSIYKNLVEEGYDVIAGVRFPQKFDGNAISIDFLTLKNNTEFIQQIKGFDIIINAVGIIAPKYGQSFEQMHTIAPITLFDIAKEAGVKKIVQISALGSQKGTTLYHTSKNKADEYLRTLDVDYIILHPSIVYGDDGKSTALFQALASLPFTPIIGEGSQKLQPITIDDLVVTIQKAILPHNKNLELDVVGEEPVSYKELLQNFRKWLGYKSTKTMSLPTFGINIIGKILDEPTVHQDNIVMLNEGSTADVKPLARFLGYTPIGFKEKLSKNKANNAQKLYASLYLIRPLLRIIIGIVWIWSGIVSSFLYPQPLALELLHEIGIPVGLDIPLLYVASFLDIGIGILTIIGYRIQALLIFQIIVISVYTLVLSLLAPYHWLHPFGPVLKNIPLILSIYILGRLEEYR